MPRDPTGFVADDDISSEEAWSDGGNDAFDDYGFTTFSAGNDMVVLDISLGERAAAVDGIEFTIISELIGNVWRVQYLPLYATDRTITVRFEGDLGSDDDTVWRAPEVDVFGIPLTYLFTHDGGDDGDPPVVTMFVPSRPSDFDKIVWEMGGEDGDEDEVSMIASEIQLPATMYVALSYATADGSEYYVEGYQHNPSTVAEALVADLVLPQCYCVYDDKQMADSGVSGSSDRDRGYSCELASVECKSSEDPLCARDASDNFCRLSENFDHYVELVRLVVAGKSNNCTSNVTWADSYGDNCKDYDDEDKPLQQMWCDGAATWAVGGIDARDMCCSCGGGTYANVEEAARTLQVRASPAQSCVLLFTFSAAVKCMIWT